MSAGLLPVLSCAALAAAERRWLRRHPGAEASLMRKAAAAVAEETRRLLGGRPGRVLVAAGKGKNGADAVLAALMLAPARRVTVVLAEGGVAAGLPARALAKARRGGARILGPEALARRPPAAEALLDGLLGSGFRPPLSRGLLAAVRWVGRAACPVVSVDVPSGAGDATDGPCVRADLTVSLGCLKAPLLRPKVAARAGRIRVADLGLGLPSGDPASSTPALPAPLAAPRPARTEKRRRGRVLAVAGSPAMPGAAVMNTEACLRAGAGLVTALVPAELRARAALALPEAMWRSQESPEDLRAARALAATADVTLVGSGLGKGRLVLARAMARAARGVLVLDADALRPDVVRCGARAAARILLPHAGEFRRIGGGAATPSNAARLARRLRAVVVLKGPMTCVTDGARTVLVPHGGPVLARGGSGDLLAGIVAAVAAARAELGLDLLGAAAAAATWHGMAADALAEAEGETPVRTTQLLDGLSPALRRARRAASEGA